MYPCASRTNKQTNKNLRCGNRKGLLGRNDQTHHRMGPKTMESIPPSKRNTQADIQLRTRQTNHQQETDGCIQIKHNPEHQPSRMSSKSTAYVPPKTASTPTKANTQTCSYLDFNQFLIRRITRNICLRLRIKQIQTRQQQRALCNSSVHCARAGCTVLHFKPKRTFKVLPTLKGVAKPKRPNTPGQILTSCTDIGWGGGGAGEEVPTQHNMRAATRCIASLRQALSDHHACTNKHVQVRSATSSAQPLSPKTRPSRRGPPKYVPTQPKTINRV